MVAGLWLQLFGTKIRPLCRNLNYELLMQNKDRAYSAGKLRKKYVCDNEM